MNHSPSFLTIRVEKARFYAFHGVFDQENRVGAEYELNVSVVIPVSASMRSDNLEGTVSYADIYEVCRIEISKPSRLIEHVALRIVKALSEKFPQIVSGTIEFRKVHPPIAGFDGSAAVKIDF